MDEPHSEASAALSQAVRDTLYFESPTPADPGAPRLLLVSFNFPPDPAVGGLRWQQMARYFTEQGWAIDVIARDFSDVGGLDRARLHRLSRGVRVFCVSSKEPLIGRAQKIIWPTVRRMIGQRTGPAVDALTVDEIKQQKGPRRVVRAYLGWMEFLRNKTWAHAAAAIGRELVHVEKYLAVASSGPPHMAHEAARLISRSSGIPQVMDMRDPWSLVQRLPEAMASPTSMRLARRYERLAVSHATLVTMNTEPAAAAMIGAYPEHRNKMEVVRNGSDDEPLPTPARDDCFRVRFAGSIYMDRDPRPVFRAAQLVIAELGLTPEQFMIELVGLANRYGGTPTVQIAEEEGITPFVRVGGRQQRRQAMEFLAGATMLLSLPQDSQFAIPAKIYEYLRFDAWMLVLAPEGSATEQLLRDTEADVVDQDDIEGIARALKQRYQQFVQGIRPQPVGRDGRFDRIVQSRKMLELIITRCAGGTAPRVSGGASAPASPAAEPRARSRL